MSRGRGPMAQGEKSKNFKKAMSDLINYCGGYKYVMIFAILIAIGGTICSLIGPNKLSDITDLISEPLKDIGYFMANGTLKPMDIKGIEEIAFLLVILYAISAVLSLVQGFIMATVTQKISRDLRADISTKINRMPLRYFDRTTTGDVLSRVTNDVDTIGISLNQSIGTLSTAITMFIGSIVMMFITNWVMAITAILSSIIGFFLMGKIISKSQKHFIAQQKGLGLINGHIEEIYSGHNVVKAYNAEEMAAKKFNKYNDDLYETSWKSQFYSGIMMPLMGFVGNFGYVMVCIVGALLVVNGHTTFGKIVAFMIYIRLFTNPLSQMAQAFNRLQSAGAASERVFDFLKEEEMEDESHKNQVLENVKGNIEFKNVKFGYYPDKTIIKDFSVNVKAGSKIAIVGPTGAGKTTIVNLLMRFYEVNEGDILIDGVSIKDITRNNLHSIFGMVLQDTWLFEGTIKDNLKYGKEDVSDEKVYEAAKMAHIDHFIKTLPNGYDTILDENANISQGQKQLFTIARAMIEDAPMLILDEATSSVDTRTEVLIQSAMDNLSHGRTSFVIAHRLSTIKNADLILVMKDGDIIESGNHEQLLNQNGFYKELYNSQFEE